jgi:hypothetical protein
MIRLFTRPTRTVRRPLVPSIARKVFLNLTPLEARDCPDGGGSFNGFSQDGGPAITLAVTYNAQKSVTLAGAVTDSTASNAGLTVTFSGSAVGSTTTGTGGAYTLTLNADSLGAVTARVTDANNQTGNASVTLTSNVPSIGGLGYATVSAGVYALSGVVTDESAPGLTVKIASGSDFTGWMNDTATVATNSTFQFSETAGTGDPTSGWVYFQVTDWWGQTSQTASLHIN